MITYPSFPPPVLSVLILSSYVAFPLLAGFLAGLLAHQAPYVHAVAAPLLGSATYAFMHESITFPEGGWWVVVNAAGAITEAWLSTRTKKEANRMGSNNGRGTPFSRWEARLGAIPLLARWVFSNRHISRLTA
jgi:hypothetical protein